MAKKLIKILFMLGNYTYHLGPGEKDAPPHQYKKIIYLFGYRPKKLNKIADAVRKTQIL